MIDFTMIPSRPQLILDIDDVMIGNNEPDGQKNDDEITKSDDSLLSKDLCYHRISKECKPPSNFGDIHEENILSGSRTC